MNGQEQIAEQFSDIVGLWRVQTNFPLKQLTTFRIGGPAAYVVTPSSLDELKKVLLLCRENGLKTLILGNGSNILASDEGFQGVVIHLDAEFCKVRIQTCIVEAECGISLSALAKRVAEKGLSGLEFASGIPGSLGGAVYMNAGAYGSEMKDILLEVTILDALGNVRRLDKAELQMGYRTSIFQYKSWTLLSVILQLEESTPEKVKATMQDLDRQRNAKQPRDRPSAGSIFKRPEGHYAGTLIEQAGLKGYQIGGAMVSPKHAGFIVNTGEATCQDVINLIRHIQAVVKEKSGVQLEPEVRYLTPRGFDVIR